MTESWLAFLIGAPVWGSLGALVFGALVGLKPSREVAPEARSRVHPALRRDAPRDIVSLEAYRLRKVLDGSQAQQIR